MKKRIVNAALESRVNAIVNRRASKAAVARAGQPQSGEPKRWYNFVNKDEESDLYIYDEISSWWGVGANDFVSDLSDVDAQQLNLYINSPGGSVFEGYAIYAALIRHSEKKNCTINVIVDGWAASIASVIAMAGDNITIGAHAQFMIHSPWSYAVGSAEDMRAEADVLDDLEESIVDIYEARTGGDREEIANWVKAETWFKGQAAVDAGFADEVIDLKRKKDGDKEDRVTAAPAASHGADYFSAIFPNMPDDVQAALSKRPTLEISNEIHHTPLPTTTREFRDFLRNAGFSGQQADAIAGHGFKSKTDPRDEAAGDGKTTTSERRDDAEKLGNALAIVRAASARDSIVNASLI